MQSDLNKAQAHPSVRPTVSAHSADGAEQKRCGHDGHIGSCPVCQRAQLLRWRAQLAEVS